MKITKKLLLLDPKLTDLTMGRSKENLFWRTELVNVAKF